MVKRIRASELFNEAEDILSTEDTEPESDTTTVTYERKQAAQTVTADLPRERIVHDIDDADKACGL